MIEEVRVNLQCIKGQVKYVHFIEVNVWEQNKWSALQSIFVGSADIGEQLPGDSKRFDQIDVDECTDDNVDKFLRFACGQLSPDGKAKCQDNYDMIAIEAAESGCRYGDSFKVNDKCSKQQFLNNILITVPLQLSQMRVTDHLSALPASIEPLFIFELKSLDRLQQRIVAQWHEKLTIKKEYVELTNDFGLAKRHQRTHRHTCDAYGNIEQGQQAENQNLRPDSEMTSDKIGQLKLNQVGVDIDVLAKIKTQKQFDMGAYVARDGKRKTHKCGQLHLIKRPHKDSNSSKGDAINILYVQNYFYEII